MLQNEYNEEQISQLSLRALILLFIILRKINIDVYNRCK